MRTAGSGTGSELKYDWEGESVSLTDSPLSPSSLSFAGYRSGALEAPMPAEGLQVLATLSTLGRTTATRGWTFWPTKSHNTWNTRGDKCLSTACC